MCVQRVGQSVKEEGLPVERYVEDYQKRRLTERADIITAINILRSQGHEFDELIREITKVFYVDLDEFNEIIRQAA